MRNVSAPFRERLVTLALAAVERTAAAVGEGTALTLVKGVKPGDQVRFEPGSPAHGRGARTGRVAAIASIGRTLERLGEQLGASRAELWSLCRTAGVDLDRPPRCPLRTILLPVVALDPSPGLPLPGVRIPAELGQFKVVYRADAVN